MRWSSCTVLVRQIDGEAMSWTAREKRPPSVGRIWLD